MSKSKIEWTDAVWNPTTGCSKVSSGCANCYAEREWHRLAGNPMTAYYGRKFNDVACHPERLDQPLRWKKPRKIFVNSMSDLFHDDVPEKFIAKVFAIMDLARHHTYMVLTKRPERAARLLSDDDFQFHVGWFQSQAIREFNLPEPKEIGPFPLKNVWLGVSVENQATADERIPLLLQTPAVVKFISAEPLLGPVSLAGFDGETYRPWLDSVAWKVDIDWVIVGGESGPNARPMHPDWVRSLRDQCQAAGVPFFFKQWGEWLPNDQEYDCNPGGVNYEQRHQLMGGTAMCRVGKKKAGRLIDGRTWDELPEVKP